MKNIILTMAVVLLSMNVAQAKDSLQFIVPGDGTGSFKPRIQELKQQLSESYGADVDVRWVGNCAKAKQIIQSTVHPTITIWDAGWNTTTECKFDVSTSNIIAVETNYMRFCASNVAVNTSGALIAISGGFKVGHSTPHTAYSKWFDKFNHAAKTNLSPVPYGSSGRARRGMLAGDVDYIFVSPSNANKVMKNGGKCDYSTAPNGEPKYNLAALRTVVDFPEATINQAYFYSSKNVSEADLFALRDLFSFIADDKTSNYNVWADTKDISLSGISKLDTDEMLTLVETTVELWSN